MAHSAAIVIVALTTFSGCMRSTDAKIQYGLQHYRMGLYGQAIQPLLAAAERLDDVVPTDPRLPAVLDALGHMAVSERRPDLADDFFARGVARSDALQPPDERVVQRALVSYGLFLSEQDRAQEAAPLLERARDIAATWPDDRVGYAIALDNLALAYDHLERWDHAARQRETALAVMDAEPGTDANRRTRAVIVYNGAVTAEDRGDLDAAAAGIELAIAAFEAASPHREERWRLCVMRRAYARVARARGGDDATDAESRAAACH